MDPLIKYIWDHFIGIEPVMWVYPLLVLKKLKYVHFIKQYKNLDLHWAWSDTHMAHFYFILL